MATFKPIAWLAMTILLLWTSELGPGLKQCERVVAETSKIVCFPQFFDTCHSFHARGLHFVVTRQHQEREGKKARERERERDRIKIKINTIKHNKARKRKRKRKRTRTRTRTRERETDVQM